MMVANTSWPQGEWLKCHCCTLLYGLMIISHSMYWERLVVILYATKIVCFCSEPAKLLFQLDICCSLFDFKIFGHLDSISVARVRSHGSSSKALLGRNFYCYCSALDRLRREDGIFIRNANTVILCFFGHPFSKGSTLVKYRQKVYRNVLF